MADEATILICDDEPSVRELMRLSVDPGHTVVEAADGVEAIALADRLRPDLVVVDVMMPGATGLEVVGHLRGSPDLDRTPVVVVSALATERDRSAALAAGADEFLPKPFEPDDLHMLVEELLAARR
jgi:CheY-like chemotaxis protein